MVETGGDKERKGLLCVITGLAGVGGSGGLSP